MGTKQLLALRLDGVLVEKYRNAAKEANQTITEYVTDKLKGNSQGIYETHQNKILEEENKRLRESLRKLTGKEPKRTRSISFSVTAQEHYEFTQAAKNMGITKADLCRKIFSNNNQPKQLT